ncbi:ABCE1 [Symbiodinium natans]|uniref:ABCE1 protein n=1 Tax=Symbiodinium natans TaxID=878477 RepID=A0A812JQG6_9DINO|nr:ABCE1 [Symbiodinium natans]
MYNVVAGKLLRTTLRICPRPSSYLDVRQRIAAAQVIRSLQTTDNYIIVVESYSWSSRAPLSIVGMLRWGSAGAYGVVTMPFSVREGINVFLDGFIPTDTQTALHRIVHMSAWLECTWVSLTFKVSEDLDPSKLDRMHNTECLAFVDFSELQLLASLEHDEHVLGGIQTCPS